MNSGRLRPPSFDGDFLDDDASIDAWAGASGPFYLPPLAVARPSDAIAVSTLVTWAAASGVPLVPRGAGSGMPGGNVGRHVVLDLSRLDRIEITDEDRIRAGAGAIAADVRARALRHDRDLPALPSSAPWCTIGGIVANDAAGARSFRWGPAHAWVERLDVIGVDGELRTLRRGAVADPEVFALHTHLLSTLPVPLSWPEVRKNASGYAIDRFLETGDPLDLWVGSEGTLGVIVAAELRTFPVPEARGVALIGPGSRAALPEVAALAGSLGATACEWFGERLLDLGGLGDDPRLDGLDATAGICLVEVAGAVDEVAEALDRIASAPIGAARTTTDATEIDAFWGLRHDASPRIEARAGAHRRSTQFIEDCVVPVHAIPAWLDRLDEALDRHGVEAVVFGHLGDGNLHVNPLLDLSEAEWRGRARRLMEEVVDIVADLGGTLSGEHGDGRLRGAYHTRIWGEEVTRAFSTIKRAFDPLGIFNPGVVVPLPGQDPFAGFGAAPDFAHASRGPARRRARELVAPGEGA